MAFLQFPEEWYRARYEERHAAFGEWLKTAERISVEEYREIPGGAVSFVPFGFLGEGKLDDEKRLVAYRATVTSSVEPRALRRSPSYDGPI